MGTLLDVSILSNFTNIFLWIFIFAVIYGILEFTHPFGSDKKPLHAIIALVIAIVVLFSRNAMLLLRFMLPWFIIMALAIFFILMLVKMFGTSDDTIANLIKLPRVYSWIIIFIALILIVGFANLYGQNLLEKKSIGRNGDGTVDQLGEDGEISEIIDSDLSGSTTTNDFQDNIYATLFNKKVLGMIVLLMVAVFAMILLTKPMTIPT